MVRRPARFTLFPSATLFRSKELLDEMKLGDFKALPAEQVNGRAAAGIAYQITIASDNQTVAATVWIDTATHLPLKRTLRFDKWLDGAPGTITETYHDFRLNP